MNRTTKVILSSMLAAGTVFGVGLSTDTPPVKEAHAATAPYYSYTGYAGNHVSFVLNQLFINSLKYDTFRMNGIKIPYTTGKNHVNKYKGTVKKYDQSFSGVNTKKTSAGSVEFKVTSHLSVKQLKEAYGKGLRALPNKHKGTKTYACSPGNKHYGISFTTKNNKVTKITIGTLGVTGEKF
ncbi:immunodominant staphylococcal antigen IsaB family protein [Staphylococcus capitis]|uniref:immunodominant staphylococcal antigen IsaB family protein n=1 Tax=Staphylococcus capitis TaxID=29388 RepID=UPI003458079B